MKTEMPGVNQRIKQLVDHYAGGNVSKFVRTLNDGGHEVSQQKFNRLFNVDTRTDKFPSVPTDIITAITETFNDINYSWLLTGDGQMHNNDLGKPKPGDVMNPGIALSLAILDDYISWKAKETGIDYKVLKASVFEKANTILRNFDGLPYGGQFGDQ